MRKERIDCPFFMIKYATYYDKRFNSYDRDVYGAVVSRCMRTNSTSVGEATLAEDLSLSLRTVQRSMAKLMQYGLITRQRRMGTSSITYVVDVRDLYDNVSTTYFNVTLKASKKKAETKKKVVRKKKAAKKDKQSRLIGGTTVTPNRRNGPASQTRTSRLTRRGNYIKDEQIKSEVDKDPPAGDKTQTYEKARDGSRYEYRRLKNLPGIPQSNLDAFVTIAAKQCAEHGIEQEDHIITAVGKGIACLADWKEKEYLRDTVACFRKVIGNIVYDISQKVRVEYEPESASDGWPGLYDNPEE